MQSKKEYHLINFTSFVIVCCWSVLFLAGPALCQQCPQYTFRHLTQADGLLHSEIRSIVEDNRGYIWIISANGLQRYDGSRFVNYPYDVNSINGIMNPGMADMFADKKQNCLWITYGPVQRFDPVTNTFRIFNADSANAPGISVTYTDQMNNAWRLSGYGLTMVDKADKQKNAQYFLFPGTASNRNTFFVTDTLQGQVWLANYFGLFLLDKHTRKVYSHDYNTIRHPLLQFLAAKNLNGIMQDSRGNIWIGSESPIFFRYNKKLKQLSSYSLTRLMGAASSKIKQEGSQSVRCFFEDDHHKVWIGTANAGLLAYNNEADTFTIIPDEPNKTGGLHYNFEIRNIFQDKQQNIWLATDDGVSLFNPYRNYFQSTHHQEDNPLSLPKNEIQTILQTADGTILIGTWGGGISVYDSLLTFRQQIDFTTPVEANLVWSFVQNNDGNIWAGCQHGYLHIYNPQSGSIHTIHPPEVENMTIRCMAKDRDGNIFLGLHNGKIITWNNALKKFIRFNDRLQTIEPSNAVFQIFFDTRQHCWVLTEAGLKQFDPGKRIFTSVYTPHNANKDSLAAVPSGSIEQLNDSMLAIGTIYGGFSFFNTSKRAFTRISTLEGSPSAIIYSIKKDDNNNLWFTTDYGLYRFNLSRHKLVHYDLPQGMMNAAFKPIGFYKLKNNSWVTATATELIHFDPAIRQASDIDNAKVQITGLTISGKPVFVDSFLFKDRPVTTNYNKNFITIEYSLLDFTNLRQKKYYYRLSSVDETWVDAGPVNFASYTNLAPGQYLFEVKAASENFMTASAAFRIIVTPPFWLTGWFKSLCTLAILWFAYLLAKWRIKAIKAVEAEKLKVQELNAEQFKNKLEMERIINYFSSSLIDKHTVDDVLWDVAKNLIGRLGFEDCMMYLWNEDKTKMVQRAGFGPKGSIEEIQNRYFDAGPGQGVVGYVMQTKEPVLIQDTSKDARYRVDEMMRLSEITVPIIYDDELIGVIDSEHHEKAFYTKQHLQVLSTIATLTANKIKSVESAQSLQQSRMEMIGINERLSEAKLQAIRSQMNPHFIFNCLNSIDNLIQNNENDKATNYLAKFAKLIRLILETSNCNTVSCWRDLETLQLYLELESLRFDNKFVYSLEVAAEITNGDYKVPPLIIQPFVENAIHHGLLNKIDSNKELNITVSVAGNDIRYIIKDNGVGRAKAADYHQLNRLPHQSMGVQLTTDRINLFNHRTETSVHITDLYHAGGQAAGTKVEVLIHQS